jgi:B-cell receptor-associated protein 31
MTLYFSLVFGFLVAEMALFMLLILPLPFKMKRALFTFISENPVIAKIQYWMKICFIFIGILFIDSLNRVWRVQVELAALAESNKNAAAVLGHERLEVQARKFYSQRNMYLTGFTLFLSLILNQTYVMIRNVMRLEDKVRQLEGTSREGAKQSEKLAVAGDPGEIARLKKELARKDQDLETLRKQASGLHREYDTLADKYAETQGKAPKKDS